MHRRFDIKNKGGIQIKKVLISITCLLFLITLSGTASASTVTKTYQDVTVSITAPDTVATNTDFNVIVNGFIAGGTSWDVFAYSFEEDGTLIEGSGFNWGYSYSKTYTFNKAEGTYKYTFIFGDRRGGHDWYDVAVDVYVNVHTPISEVTIDIKPGSFPNSINLGTSGTVPVAIFSTPTFDATTVNATTVNLASAPVKLKGQGTPMVSFEDINKDGLLDLVVHVSTEALQLSETDTEAVLEGQTFAGIPVRGVDTVRVVP